MSRNIRWQVWLKNLAPDLYADLMKTLDGNSCKANKEKMMQVLVALGQRGHQTTFEEFVRSDFPYLEDLPPRIVAGNALPNLPVKKKEEKIFNMTPEEEEAVNKHKVFKMYRPHALTFPCHLIIIDPNKEILKKRVMTFIRNKIGIDWIVVEDRAYVEYYFEQHRTTLAKMKPEEREIYQYRRSKGLPDGTNGL